MKTALTELEIIVKARDMIANPDKWCQGTARALANGTPCGYRNLNCARICASEALAIAASRDTTSVAYRLAQNAILSFAPKCVKTIHGLNDRYGHHTVIAFFNRAIIQLGGTP